MIDTFSRASRHLLENLAFADYLSPLCLVKFMFPNIPCGTYRNSGRPASLCAMFDDDRSPLHVLHFWSFRIAVNDICSPRVVIIFIRLCMSQKILCLRISHFRMICFPFSSYLYVFYVFLLRNESPIRSVLRFRSYASTLSRLVSSAQESQK